MAERTLNTRKRPVQAARGRRHQRGEALLDAMLATLMVMILGMGPLYVMTKAAVMQREGTAQQLVSAQLRTLLQTTPKSQICNADGSRTADWSEPSTMALTTSGSGTSQQVDMTISALCYSENITVNGVSVPQVQLTLVGCLPAALGMSGPVVLREGATQNDEPTACTDDGA